MRSPVFSYYYIYIYVCVYSTTVKPSIWCLIIIITIIIRWPVFASILSSIIVSYCCLGSTLCRCQPCRLWTFCPVMLNYYDYQCFMLYNCRWLPWLGSSGASATSAVSSPKNWAVWPAQSVLIVKLGLSSSCSHFILVLILVTYVANVLMQSLLAIILNMYI